MNKKDLFKEPKGNKLLSKSFTEEDIRHIKNNFAEGIFSGDAERIGMDAQKIIQEYYVKDNQFETTFATFGQEYSNAENTHRQFDEGVLEDRRVKVLIQENNLLRRELDHCTQALNHMTKTHKASEMKLALYRNILYKIKEASK